MDISKLAGIWELMNQFKFEVDPDSIHDDLSCTICKNLMCDACHGVCGCQFCYKCITEYIGDSEKYCPGDKINCKHYYLNKNKGVLRDARMNLRIFKTRVICPNESCNYIIELAQMREHLSVCEKRSIDCPFVTIGCDKGNNIKEGIFNHLRNDTLSHTELLMECIFNLRNEVREINTRFEISNLKIDNLIEESRTKDIHITEMRNEIIALQNKMEEEMKTKKGDGIVETAELKKEMSIQKKIKRAQKREIKKERAEKKRETNNQKTGDRILVKGYESTQFCNVDDEMMAKFEKINNLGASNELFQIFDVDFVWKIDEISKKNGERILSESFYSFNYKFCLRLWLIHDNIRLYCVIMRGYNDDKVQWPMKRPVTISVINQDTMKTYKSETIQYDTYKRKEAFDRPQNDRNQTGIGVEAPIQYSSINNNRSIILDDSIIVSCAIGDE